MPAFESGADTADDRRSTATDDPKPMASVLETHLGAVAIGEQGVAKGVRLADEIDGRAGCHPPDDPIRELCEE